MFVVMIMLCSVFIVNIATLHNINSIHRMDCGVLKEIKLDFLIKLSSTTWSGLYWGQLTVDIIGCEEEAKTEHRT